MKRIGWAVKQMLNGDRVARSGWNGKGMFIFRVKANAYPPTSPVAQRVWGVGSLVPYQAYIAMRTVDGSVVPWLCSQSDLLATDWCLID